ncbi:MAG: Holliday junction branch migration protein RuvA [Thermodesulfovibrionales bacterium]|nr:Holliday junction branch migration protein RuvA [Thermodesulfovibrionales bacterium]
MIGSLRGRLLIKRPDNLIVEAGGVGYQVNVPLSMLSDLPEEGRDVFLHIYTHVREDAFQLYGFTDEGGKKIFMLLLGVTGIGPKAALNILSGISPSGLMKAVETEDVSALTRLPGLGKKTAERLVLELRGKLPARAEGAGPKDMLYEDALSALLNFGYRRPDALEAVEKAHKKGYSTIEGLLKEALRLLTGASGEK